jgi:GTPase SAR1 family protein
MLEIKNFSDNKHLRPKAGKTSLLYKLVKEKYNGDLSKLLLLAFEKGYNALNGINAVDIEDWDGFVDLVDELVEKKDEVPYRILGMDTVDMAQKLCEKYVLNQLSIQDTKTYKVLQDVGYGKAHNMLESAFLEQVTKLDQAGYHWVFITHDKEKTVKHKNGQEYDKTTLSLQGKIRDVVLNMVDFIVYIDIAQEKVGKEYQDVRYIHFRGDSTLEAGSRFANVPDKIKYSPTEFINVIEEAILAEYNGDSKAVEKQKQIQFEEHEEKSNEYIEKQKNSIDKLHTSDELIEHLKNTIGNYSDDETKMAEIKTVIKKHNNKKVDYTKMTDVDSLKAIAEFVDSLK